jgi:iron(III) transport system permease protein
MASQTSYHQDQGRTRYILSWLRSSTRWVWVQLIISLILFAPLLALTVIASGDTGGAMSHLVDTKLALYFTTTLQLMAGVGLVALFFGVTTAWVVSRYDFIGRPVLEWMLVLPAAIPAYIIAYTYTDFLEYAGPVQTAIRNIFGFQSARDYWFPEIRSMGGAIIVMGAVLYPYVYITTRTAFRLTSTRLFEAARLVGGNMFFGIALPLARPAIVAGLALVMMEVISDFGTVEYFTLETLTLGIFNVWLGMGNLAAAARIALMAFVIVIILLGIERWAMSGRRVENRSRGSTGVLTLKLKGWQGICAVMICLLPIILGFFIPVGVLLNFVLLGFAQGIPEATTAAIQNTLMVAFIGGLIIMIMALFIGIIARFQSGLPGRILAILSSSGYAVPGTILAIGVLGCVFGVEEVWRKVMGDNAIRLVSGTLAVLIFAYIVRFQAVGYGAVNAGLKRLPPNLMPASQVLGHPFSSSVMRITVPLLRSSLLAGLLVAFVDIMKELPMTLLLSPFNFETLATLTYQFAKNEMLEAAAVPALLIVLAGLIPVIIINRFLLLRDPGIGAGTGQ